VQGIVIAAQIFSRRNQEKDKRAKEIEESLRESLLTDQKDEIRILSDSFYSRMKKMLIGQTTPARRIDDNNKVLLPRGQGLDAAILDRIPRSYWSEIQIKDSNGIIESKLESLAQARNDSIAEIEKNYREKIARLTKTEVGNGVLKKLKCILPSSANCRGREDGGRHGNKESFHAFCLPRICPTWPTYAVDIVLNPLASPHARTWERFSRRTWSSARELGRQIPITSRIGMSSRRLRTQFKKLYPTQRAANSSIILPRTIGARWPKSVMMSCNFSPRVRRAPVRRKLRTSQMACQDTLAR
jgi:hypothetical protein